MDIAHRVIELKFARPWATSRTTEPGGLKCSEVVHVTARDEVSGAIGFGEAAPISRYGESTSTVRSFLARLDGLALSLDRLDESLGRMAAMADGNCAAKCAVEMALLDAAAKRAGQPVWQCLSLAPPAAREISYTIGIGTTEQVREQVRRAGPFRILKLKLGGPDDRGSFQALREIAPTKRVYIDANEGWRDREQALRMIEWLARDTGVALVEQPLPAGSPVADHRWLYERSPLPLFADESCHSSGEVEHLSGCFHGVNVKLMKTGGLKEAVRTLHRVRQLGMETMLGCMIETSLGIAASFQLASLADHLDLDSHLLVANDPFTGLTLEAGSLRFAEANPAAGLGVQPADG